MFSSLLFSYSNGDAAAQYPMKQVCFGSCPVGPLSFFLSQHPKQTSAEAFGELRDDTVHNFLWCTKGWCVFLLVQQVPCKVHEGSYWDDDGDDDVVFEPGKFISKASRIIGGVIVNLT